jgi:hypothetical protein
VIIYNLVERARAEERICNTGSIGMVDLFGLQPNTSVVESINSREHTVTCTEVQTNPYLNVFQTVSQYVYGNVENYNTIFDTYEMFRVILSLLVLCLSFNQYKFFTVLDDLKKRLRVCREDLDDIFNDETEELDSQLFMDCNLMGIYTVFYWIHCLFDPYSTEHTFEVDSSTILSTSKKNITQYFYSKSLNPLSAFISIQTKVLSSRQSNVVIENNKPVQYLLCRHLQKVPLSSILDVIICSVSRLK